MKHNEKPPPIKLGLEGAFGVAAVVLKLFAQKDGGQIL